MKLTTPVAVLIGALFISVSILASGGFGLNKLYKLVGIPDCSAPETAEEIVNCLNTKLVTLASKINVDKDKFQSCLSSKKYQDEITKDQQDAEAAGLNGTPGFVIGPTDSNGNISGIGLSGAYPYVVFKAVLDKYQAGETAEQILASEDIIPELNNSPLKDVLIASAASVDNDPQLGKKDSPLTIIEFSDYECPFCKRHFEKTYPSLKKDYIDSGKARLVYRDFIAVEGHNPAATQEALATECVKELGGDEVYFKYHDLLFTHTKSNGVGISL